MDTFTVFDARRVIYQSLDVLERYIVLKVLQWEIVYGNFVLGAKFTEIGAIL